MTAKPDSEAGAKQGLKDGETPNTDQTRKPDRPVDEEDTFGGAERTHRGEDVESDSAKP